jgi:flagellar hook-associated protein 1 FlgK
VANLADLAAEQEGGYFIGQGVTVQSVLQQRSQFIEAQLPGALSNASSASAAVSTLTGLTALDPNAAAGLSTQLGTYYAALQALAQNPGDPSLRQAAVSAAQALATAFNQTSQAITRSQNGVDSQLPSLAAQVNSLTSQFATLNAQIKMDEASGATPNDLLDQRQSLQDQIEQLTGAVPIPEGGGEIDLTLANGTPLVSGDQASVLSTTPNAANGGHLDLVLTPPGSAAQIVPGASFGGTIGGLVSSRDGALATALTSLDSMAFDLGNASNAVQTAGFDINGNPGVAPPPRPPPEEPATPPTSRI